MTNQQRNYRLGKTLWAIAKQLRGAMNADDFRDYTAWLLVKQCLLLLAGTSLSHSGCLHR